MNSERHFGEEAAYCAAILSGIADTQHTTLPKFSFQKHTHNFNNEKII